MSSPLKVDKSAVTKPKPHGLTSFSKRGSKHTRTLPVHWQRPLTVEENQSRRAKYLAPTLKAHYAGTAAGPLKPRHGLGPYLYDDELNEYLDCVNNVCHVGHTHPRVVQAATQQLGLLNTNSRYVHDNIVRLAEALIESVPAPLSKVFFCELGKRGERPRAPSGAKVHRAADCLLRCGGLSWHHIRVHGGLQLLQVHAQL